MMRLSVLACAAAGALAGLASLTASAQAMPLPVPASEPSLVTEAAWVCPAGWHLDRLGGCLRDGVHQRPVWVGGGIAPPLFYAPPPRVAYARPALVYGRWVCPVGAHSDPYHRVCLAN